MRLTWSDNYSDCKGRYLNDVLHHFPDFNVHFEGRSGLRLSHGLYFLESNVNCKFINFSLWNAKHLGEVWYLVDVQVKIYSHAYSTRQLQSV